MAEIVLVHGISQQQTPGPRLEQDWILAMAGALQVAGFMQEADRLRFAHGMPGRIDARMAYYGNLFLKAGAMGAADDIELERLSPSAQELLEAIARDWLEQAANRARLTATRLIARAELAALSGAPEGAQAQGQRFGSVVRRALDALTRVPGLAPVAMSVLSRFVVTTLSQVTRYLSEVEVREAVQQRIASLIGNDTRVIIGHSLGSVAAYEAAHRLERRLPLLVTLGSPLGLRSIVLDKLVPPAGFPRSVDYWLNIADSDDYIAMLPDLALPFGHDKPVNATFESLCLVDNEEDAHSDVRYLCKVELGRRLGPVLQTTSS